MALVAWVLVFLPSLVFWLADATGFIPTGEAGYAASTAAALLQGLFFIPALVISWRRFKEAPEKFSPSLRVISIIDYLLVGIVLILVILGVVAKHGR